jgi:amino acid transporter
MGWLYFYYFAIIVAFKLTAARILIHYWPNDVHIGVWTTVLLVVAVAGLNFCLGVSLPKLNFGLPASKLS